MKYAGITEEQQEALVDIFKTCPLCVIRDTLIDAGLMDETFPHFYNSFDHGISVFWPGKIMKRLNDNE